MGSWKKFTKDKNVVKTLWHLRFKKLKKTEEDAACGYQEILDKCLDGFEKDSQVIKNLNQLVKEENAHAKLAEELIEICRRNHPDVEIL